jgi:gentisate 1,2-dioxygenase
MTTEADCAMVSPADRNATLREALAAASAAPLWECFRTLLTKEPQFFEPFLWAWSTMSPLVDRAAREVNMAEAERRVLLLTHPGFAGTIFTTPTLSAGLQILNPGESAHAHRHTVAALRLVMMGEGAQTITDGKVCPMEPGDLILTPAWTWHEHRHNGATRTVWLDGLDFPLSRMLGSIFLEFGPAVLPEQGFASILDAALREGGVLPEGQEHEKPYSPLFRYPWQGVRDALDSMRPADDGSKRIRYVNPIDGGPVMPTIDCFAHRLGSAAPTRRVRTTSTAIVLVIEGEGETSIGEQVLRWQQHDVFVLPRWQWIQHTAHSAPATLFLMTDRALMQYIGHLREESGAVI